MTGFSLMTKKINKSIVIKMNLPEVKITLMNGIIVELY